MIVSFKSWGSESDRMKEKLLVLIGRIGKEARVGKITTKVHLFKKINHCTAVFSCTCMHDSGFLKLLADIFRRHDGLQFLQLCFVFSDKILQGISRLNCI